MSVTGKNLRPNNFVTPYKYIATLPGPKFEYFIKNGMELWKKLCTDMLFGVWDPFAPYNRFADSNKPKSKFRIQLLRIYEIDQPLLFVPV